MTQQDDITQRVLTDDEINDLCGWRSSNTTLRAENDRALAREVESALLSKLRAPVADETTLQVWAERFPEISDMGRLRDAWNEARASAPVADERELRSAAQAFYDASKTVVRFAVESLDDRDALVAANVRLRAALASAPVAGEAQPVAHWIPSAKTFSTARVSPGKAWEPLYAAPQASAESVRNAALYLLREARKMLPAFATAEAIGAWSEKVRKFGAGEVIDVPPQADKDGGQLLARDALINALGQCRDAFPIPDIVGSQLDLLWQEAMSDPAAVPAYVKACAARAALSAPQAEQGERDA